MRFFTTMLAVLAFTVTAQAQDKKKGKITPESVENVLQQADELAKSSCGQAAKEVFTSIGTAIKKSRAACAALRNCKKDCRASKRSDRQSVKAGKKDCKASCKGKKGKDKRKCMKACRKTSRSKMKTVRSNKRGCMKTCRTKFKTPECRQARKGVFGAFGKALKKLAQNKDCKAKIQALIKKLQKAEKAEEKEV